MQAHDNLECVLVQYSLVFGIIRDAPPFIICRWIEF